MSPRWWTPGSAGDTVLVIWPFMVARNGHVDAEGNQQLWAMHPAWRQLCQSPSVTYHCYCTFGVATHWLCQYWDNYGVGSTPKHGEPFGLLWPLYEAHYGYVTPDQTAKTVAKFLWQGYILIFRTLGKILSDEGANFESNIIRELCKCMGKSKVMTSPYHAQTNGLVEWAHQMLMHMVGKLSKDWKTDWPRHLPELVHAYNSMRLAITRYSPHYLIFGHWPCLPVDFYFPMIKGTKTPGCWPLHC